MTAGFLALAPGAFFHGLGHFHLGQEERGLALLATEVAGLSLVIMSDVLESDNKRRGRFDGLQDVLAQSGWGHFLVLGSLMLSGRAEALDPLIELIHRLGTGD